MEIRIKKFPKLGEIISWDFGNERLYNYDYVMSQLNELGLDLEIKPNSKYDSCIKILQADLKWGNFDIIWRREQKTIFVGIVNVQDGIHVDNILRFRFSRKNFVEKMETELLNPQYNELLEYIKEKIVRYQESVDREQLSISLARYFSGIGIRIRARGGIYWVLSDRLQDVDKVEEFLRRVDSGIKLNRIGIVDEERTRQEIFALWRDEVEQIVEGIRGYIKELRDGAKFRQDGYYNRLDEVKKARDKTRKLVEELGIEQQRLEEELIEVESELVKIELEKSSKEE